MRDFLEACSLGAPSWFVKALPDVIDY